MPDFFSGSGINCLFGNIGGVSPTRSRQRPTKIRFKFVSLLLFVIFAVVRKARDSSSKEQSADQVCS